MFFTISHPILSCSMASIFSARAITLFIISFSSSVRSWPEPGPGCVVQLPLSAPKKCYSSSGYSASVILLHTIQSAHLHTRVIRANTMNEWAHICCIDTDICDADKRGRSRSLSTYCSLSLCRTSHIGGMRGKQWREQHSVRRIEELNNLKMLRQPLSPSMHPLPVVGRPAIRAAAHHSVCHAALSQPAGGQKERHRWIKHEIVRRSSTRVPKKSFLILAENSCLCQFKSEIIRSMTSCFSLSP